jgi:hypothetical protein
VRAVLSAVLLLDASLPASATDPHPPLQRQPVLEAPLPFAKTCPAPREVVRAKCQCRRHHTSIGYLSPMEFERNKAPA